ncbi:carbohydrate sulfotransferase 10-like [Ylistrum balloti]|uniref:carbohydrate sulfotransferase 10-like n=1 Tax=Ylistrum balloti TaxID=509963 RepID=UPI002905EFC0|nr:carbohydrate sulfotransferase 10-like [Ylistrum balloti]
MDRYGRRKVIRYVLSLLVLVPLLLETTLIIYIFMSRQYTLQKQRTLDWHSVTSEVKHDQPEQQKVPTHPPLKSILDRRKVDMDSECGTKSIYPLSENHTLVYNKAYNFIYCEVPKVGSTFWKRFLHQIRTNTIASPFDIKPQIVNDLKVNDEFNNISSTLKNSTKFLFVRSPYHRLFSGYIDKLYSPNPYFWSLIGKHIVKKFRNSSVSHNCGHDVTFQEFLQYAVHSENTHENQNNHIMSYWQLCSPCHVKYDVIGKMETFKNDTEYLLDKLHLKQYKDILRNMSFDAVNDALYDTAQAYVAMRTYSRRCISPQEAADRTWTKLKVRGFIADDLPVPTGLNLKMVNEVFELFQNGYLKSVSKLGNSGLKHQQRIIFQQAFRKIPRQIIKDIQKAFDMDFRIFGYDKQIVDTNNEAISDIFIKNVMF